MELPLFRPPATAAAAGRGTAATAGEAGPSGEGRTSFAEMLGGEAGASGAPDAAGARPSRAAERGESATMPGGAPADEAGGPTGYQAHAAGEEPALSGRARQLAAAHELRIPGPADVTSAQQDSRATAPWKAGAPTAPGGAVVGVAVAPPEGVPPAEEGPRLGSAMSASVASAQGAGGVSRKAIRLSAPASEGLFQSTGKSGDPIRLGRGQPAEGEVGTGRAIRGPADGEGGMQPRAIPVTAAGGDGVPPIGGRPPAGAGEGDRAEPPARIWSVPAPSRSALEAAGGPARPHEVAMPFRGEEEAKTPRIWTVPAPSRDAMESVNRPARPHEVAMSRAGSPTGAEGPRIWTVPAPSQEALASAGGFARPHEVAIALAGGETPARGGSALSPPAAPVRTAAVAAVAAAVSRNQAAERPVAASSAGGGPPGADAQVVVRGGGVPRSSATEAAQPSGDAPSRSVSPSAAAGIEPAAQPDASTRAPAAPLSPGGPEGRGPAFQAGITENGPSLPIGQATQAQSTPASAGGGASAPVIAAMPAEAARHAAPQVVSAIAAQQAPGRIEVQLDPPELGRVEIAIDIGDQGLRATLTAERGATGDLLRRHGDVLMQQLQDAGFADVDLRFSDDGEKQGGRPGMPGPGGERGPDDTSTAGDGTPPARGRAVGTDRLDLKL